MQTATERSNEVLVAGELPGWDRGELVNAESEIAGWRTKTRRRWTFAVAGLAVTGAAKVRVDLAPVLERRGRYGSPA